MRRLYRVTYDICTPESAARGEYVEFGFIDAWGTRQPLDRAKLDAQREACRVTLREAGKLVGTLEDSGLWFTERDGSLDYCTGNTTRRALHPPEDVTPSSYERLRRLLGA